VITVRYQHPRYKFLSSFRSKSILMDLGCGSMVTLLTMKKFRSDLVYCAIDIPSAKPELCPRDVTYVSCKLGEESIPFPDNYFDGITANHLLEHINPNNYLKLKLEVVRVLKPGGKIYIETPNYTSLFIPSFSFMKKQGGPLNFFDDTTHIRPFTKLSLSTLFEDVDLQLIKVGTARNIYETIASPIIILFSFFLKSRYRLIKSIWNLTSWAIYATWQKDNNK
jgi:SAM-dependent methyltransferase